MMSILHVFYSHNNRMKLAQARLVCICDEESQPHLRQTIISESCIILASLMLGLKLPLHCSAA